MSRFPTRCPCQGFRTIGLEEGAQHWCRCGSPECAHVSRSLAWGTLDQDNTSCLVQGIPAPEDLDVVPLGPIDAVDLVMHCQFVWHLFVMAIRMCDHCNCFRSALLVNLMVRAWFVLFAKDLFLIDLCGSCKLIRNCLLYWYGYFIYSYLLLCIFFVQYLSWNPNKSSDLFSIYADFPLYTVKSVDFCGKFAIFSLKSIKISQFLTYF